MRSYYTNILHRLTTLIKLYIHSTQYPGLVEGIDCERAPPSRGIVSINRVCGVETDTLRNLPVKFDHCNYLHQSQTAVNHACLEASVRGSQEEIGS